jgi:hypothetical protein
MRIGLFGQPCAKALVDSATCDGERGKAAAGNGHDVAPSAPTERGAFSPTSIAFWQNAQARPLCGTRYWMISLRS